MSLFKRTSESILYDFDASAMLANGETITSIISATANGNGLVLAPGAINAAPISYSDNGKQAPAGTVAQVRISGGAIAQVSNSTTYVVRVKVQTSLGNIYEMAATLLVSDTPDA